MDKTNGVVILFSAIFVTLFGLSIIIPEPERARSGNKKEASLNDVPLIAQEVPLEEQLREERAKYYKSRAEDEAEYYREVAPHDIDDPDFFERSHPLQEGSLQEEPLEERPLQERPLQERPLPEKLLR